MSTDARQAQLEYSELQDAMHDEQSRRGKAAKILAVLRHFLGREDLTGLLALDLGCSTGFISDELAAAGATVVGLDIDVPGLAAARLRFGGRCRFVCADGARLPLADTSVDVVIFNMIYEHVLDPDAVMAEIRRVIRPSGVAYLGFANKWGIVEPHYNLPFLSYLPQRWADRYVAASGRADRYHEQFRTPSGLRRMARGLTVWDYTWTVLAEPDRFAARDVVPRRVAWVPVGLWRALRLLVPTFLWVGTPGGGAPAGPATSEPPHRVPTPPG